MVSRHRFLARTALPMVSLFGFLAASPAQAACINILGTNISVDLLGNVCVGGAQTLPGVVDGLGLGADVQIGGTRGTAERPA